MKLELAFDSARARADVPVLSSGVGGRPVVYLDSACTVLKPAPVVEAVSRFLLEAGGCGGRRSSHLLSQQVQRRLDEARSRVARFLSAESPNEVVFTASTTDSMNLLARSFQPEPGRDEVLLTDLSHNSALLPFVEAAKDRGWRVRVLETADGRLEPAVLEAALSEKTALVVLTRASNVHGGSQPVAELSRLARRRGARTIVDLAQYVPTHREDVRASLADFAAFSAHKLGGPFGVGVLWGKENELNALKPWRVGGGTVRSVERTSESEWRPSYLDSPERFEAGVTNASGAVGLAAALDYWESFGWDALREHVGRLAERAALRLGGLSGWRVLGSPERLREGALVSIAPEAADFPMHDLNLYLNHERPSAVAVRVGEHCAHAYSSSRGLKATLRLSFHGVNTAEDADAAADAIEAFTRLAT